MIKVLSAIVFAGASVFSQALAKNPHPLFADDEMISLTITAPMNTLVRRAERSTEPHNATLTINGAAAETHEIFLSARGNSRRRQEVCNFPPLRIEFKEKPEDASYFDGQKRLKLVTHCKRSARFQQYYLLEYTAYRLLNVASPLSLKVRLAEIDYVEEESGKSMIKRYGFLIEDTDDAAKRNGQKEIDLPDIDMSQLDPVHAGRYAVLQYMIGNLDWSMHSGPDGKDCCHNTKLIGADKSAINGLVPIAYDFDYSGLVDAPYAIPPDSVKVRSVRTRRYRGFCAHNTQALAAIANIRADREAYFAVIDTTQGLEKNTRKSARRFLEDFFKDIETDGSAQKELLKYCRD